MATHNITTYNNKQFVVIVEPKKSIVIQYNGLETRFEIGDKAEYDSYNLKYIGTIVSITDKTVTIEYAWDSFSTKKRRLTLENFTWRNYDFDLIKIQAENAETMMYI